MISTDVLGNSDAVLILKLYLSGENPQSVREALHGELEFLLEQNMSESPLRRIEVKGNISDRRDV